MGHFVLFPREREKRDSRERDREERRIGMKEEIPPLPLSATRTGGIAQL